MQVGRQVHVVGLDLPDGSVPESDFTIYVNWKPATHHPAQMNPYRGMLVDIRQRRVYSDNLGFLD